MWMGFADQQVNGSGPPPICTFAGNSAAHLTTAVAGDYFDHGAIQHLSHLILDMLQFFAMKTPASKPGADGTFVNRVQYAFHAPNLVPGNKDQFTDGGGPSLLPNQNRGPHYAEQTATGIGTTNGEQRMGHLSCLQRSSRANDGTPIHLRMDGVNDHFLADHQLGCERYWQRRGHVRLRRQYYDLVAHRRADRC